MQLYSIFSRNWKMNLKITLNVIALLLTFSALTHNDTAIAETSDLIVESVGVNKTTVTTGERFQLNARIWNQGKAASSATTLHYYLSTDGSLSTEDTAVASDSVASLLGKGKHPTRRRAEMSETLTAPDTPGVHYYGVCIAGATNESDTSNNCSQAIAMTVEAPPPTPAPSQEAVPIPRPEGPDLTIIAGRVDRSTIKLYQGVRLHITIENRGRQEAAATTIRYYRSLDATISTDDTELRAATVGQIGAGQSIATWSLLPGPTALGVYYYGARVDGVASEVDTANNASAAYEITVEHQGGPVLIASGTIPTQSLDVGGTPIVVDVSGNFVGIVETWTASSDKTDVVTVSMSGSEVTLTAVGEGWATVTVQAIRGDLVAKHTFYVSVGGVAVPEPTVPETPGPSVPNTPELAVVDPSVPDTSPEVVIPDENLRARVLYALNAKEGDILTQRSMLRLTRLNGSYDEINDITGLEHATQLADLALTHNNISDITLLANLTNLTDLGIGHNEISDITPLANLTNLTDLWPQFNKISDITPLANLTNLTILFIGHNEISDITPLANLTNLTKLAIGFNKISDITPLANLTNLTDLVLQWNNISDVTPLQNLTNLEVLWLVDNEISDVTPLQNLTNLKKLAIAENNISDFTQFANMTHLRELWLGGSTLSDLTPLQNLTNLTFLHLSYSDISDLTPLEGLTNLTELFLVDNEISDVTSLEGLTSLKVLALDGNPIENGDDEALAPLRRLKEKNPSILITIDIDAAGSPSIPELPDETALLSNYPNPFNPETWIPYQLAEAADVTLTIYDLRGVVVRRLALGHQPAGFYHGRGRAAHWDGRNEIGEKVASGLYFYTFTAGDFTATQKLLIRK